ncbi:MAG: hypothetical protein SWJ54_18865, partial [Cyanobacteriota bacterium]|nr:hypothetical protein [Cyanobacteriota bacterium]
MKLDKNYLSFFFTTLIGIGVIPIAHAESTCLLEKSHQSAEDSTSDTILSLSGKKTVNPCDSPSEIIDDQSIISSTATHPVTLNVYEPKVSEFDNLQDVEDPFTEAKYLSPEYSPPPPQTFRVTQAESEAIQITG